MNFSFKKLDYFLFSYHHRINKSNIYNSLRNIVFKGIASQEARLLLVFMINLNEKNSSLKD
tara:strand:- start:755 stop:937 length:183 start_codon:yes stop_codon:yes gene_type:complete